MSSNHIGQCVIVVASSSVYICDWICFVQILVVEALALNDSLNNDECIILKIVFRLVSYIYWFMWWDSREKNYIIIIILIFKYFHLFKKKERKRFKMIYYIRIFFLFFVFVVVVADNQNPFSFLISNNNKNSNIKRIFFLII